MKANRFTSRFALLALALLSLAQASLSLADPRPPDPLGTFFSTGLTGDLPPYIFREDFDGGALDSSVWQVYPNGGTVAVNGGWVSLSRSTSGNTFPYVHTRNSVIPQSGDFVIKVGIQYTGVTVNGTGFGADNLTPTNGSPGGWDFRPVVYHMWQDSQAGFFLADYTNAIRYRLPSPELRSHLVEFRWLDTTDEYYMDGVRVASIARGSTVPRPTVLWFGNPVQGAYPWTSFKLDYIEVASLPPTGGCSGGAVDVVFAMDTSGSMDDEFSALCDRISDVVTGLQSRGIAARYQVLGITELRACATQSVAGLIPGGTVDDFEDWGPAVVDLSNHYPWTPGSTRLIIPMSDEGPQNGEPEEDPGPDRDAVDQAIAAARANHVVVSPIQGTATGSAGDPAEVERLMRDLAASTAGLYFRSVQPANDLANALSNLIGTASCTPIITSVSPDCGITLSTTVAITGQNFQAGATVDFRLVGTAGWVPATNVTLVNATRLTFQTPLSLPNGTYEVRVTNPGGYSSASITIRTGSTSCTAGCPTIPTTPYFTHYYRRVEWNHGPAPIGSVIQALDPRGHVVGCFEVTTPGSYGYMRVYGEDTAASPPIPGMRRGEVVTFRINGECTDPSPKPVIWQDDKSYRLIDLAHPCVVNQWIGLHRGWNWFSINRQPSPTDPASVMASISGKYDLLLGEDGTFAPPPADPRFNTLRDILPSKGYMIRMLQDETLTVDGGYVAPTTPIALPRGWRWLGYLPEATQSISSALQSITGRFNLFLGETGTYAPPPADPRFNTLAQMEAGRGYLIRMTDDGTLVYPGALAELEQVERKAATVDSARPSTTSTCSAVTTPYFTQFYGEVNENGQAAPVGSTVEAFNPRGDRVGCFQVTSEGVYGYMRVYGEDASAQPPLPGMRIGETVVFRVNGRLAQAVGNTSWQDDKATREVNLVVAEATVVPLATATATVTPIATAIETLTVTPPPSLVPTATETATPTDTPTLPPVLTMTSTPQPACTVLTTPYFTQFYGEVTIGGQPAGVGVMVEAVSPRGDRVGCFQVTGDGVYGYMRVYGEDASAQPPIPGMRGGEPVAFKVDDKVAQPTGNKVWQDDKSSRVVDLAVVDTPTTATPMPTSTAVEPQNWLYLPAIWKN